MRPSILDEELFDRLATDDGAHLASVFIPTHSSGRDVSQDRIRLKNQLRRVDAELEGLGLKPRAREDRLRITSDLLEDREFWEHQAEGLAVYIHEDGNVTAVAVNYPVNESAIVMPVFLVRPLLSELKGPELPVLALTRDEVGLFVANLRGARRSLVDLPGSFEDVNWFVDREPQRQQHPDRTDTTRARHGHDPSSREDEDVNRFLREVDRALPADDPLVVLGDDNLVSRFGTITDRHVLSPENSGLQSPFTESEVMERTAQTLRSLAEQRERDAIAEANAEIGMGNATTEIAAATSAAITGRVRHLVLDPTMDPVWGRIEETTLEVVQHDDKEHADVDLIDRVVVLSMRNGAEVTPILRGSSDHPMV
ncbi:MAG TPA: hypothetical protein VFZ80_03505, partial [Acidimicrobiia bacterium]